MDKKGDIWISAILYFGLGIVVITILLTAGLPVINKLKDKNIGIQTKNSLQILDTNIREVIKGGPGTQRVVTLGLKKGEISFDSNKVKWKFNSRVFLTEPSSSCDNPPTTAIPSGSEIWISEGNVDICTIGGVTKNTYDIFMQLDYSDIAIIQGDVTTISGVGDISIRNNGVQPDCDSNCKIILSVSQI